MSSIRQQVDLKNITPGDTIQGYYILRKMEIRSTREWEALPVSGIGGSFRQVSGKIWEDAEKISPELVKGEVVKIRGQVQEYQGQSDLHIKQIRMATDSDPVEPEKLIRVSTKDLDLLYQQIIDTIAIVENLHLSTLLTSIFDDEEFRGVFSRAAGGKFWHHAMFGGLLEHTVSVMELCRWISSQYDNVNRDVLITGALLHDVGKTEELGGRWAIDYTDTGRLVGHLSQGSILVDHHIRKQEDFPPELRMQILHLILSHHGELHQGSPIVPLTLEAQILYMADQMDSQINAWQHIIERDKDEQRSWSTYIKPIERFVYLGPPEINNQPET